MDEHGKKIETVADTNKVSPIEHVDEMAKQTRELWDRLKISYDDFIRTTEKRHKTVVQKIFERLLDQGDIYLGTYSGYYCMHCESFFTESQLEEDELCPDCGREVSWLEEESYFLKLSKYQDRLLEFIENNPGFITPESRRNEVLAFIRQGLNDLSVSRTTFDWGIKVISDPKHVVYVWIDALSNYISALGYGTDNDGLFQKYWKGDEVVHVVGKDILRFHAIFWPIMLMALDIPITFKLHAHGFYMMKDGKMSKSKGGVIYPDTLLKHYGLDELRYYLLRELPYGGDGLFTPEAFVDRINFDLANDFGNLLNRTITMINKYFGGSVSYNESGKTSVDEDFETLLRDTPNAYGESMENLKVSQAIRNLWRLISRTNKYIDETTPWILAKDEDKKDELENVLYHLSDSLRQIGILLKPILLEASDALFKQLGVAEEKRSWDSLVYGAQPTFNVVHKGTPLFPRLEVEEEVDKLKKIVRGDDDTIESDKEDLNLATIDDFAKLDLRIGQIKSCKPHPNADKLLVLKVDAGEGKLRQIVAGIAKYYAPDTLVGKKIVLIRNLEPVTLRGEKSEGMLLAGSGKNRMEILEVSGLRPGDSVS
jgi:methionyl-tRNA synthetase